MTGFFLQEFRSAHPQDAVISNFPISLWDGLVIDVSFVCEFKGNSRAPGGWNNGVRHSNDVLQARANVKNNKYKDVFVSRLFVSCLVSSDLNRVWSQIPTSSEVVTAQPHSLCKYRTHAQT